MSPKVVATRIVAGSAGGSSSWMVEGMAPLPLAGEGIASAARVNQSAVRVTPPSYVGAAAALLRAAAWPKARAQPAARSGRRGQAHHEAGAAAGGVGVRDAALVGHGQRAHHGQAQAEAARLRALGVAGER